MNTEEFEKKYPTVAVYNRHRKAIKAVREFAFQQGWYTKEAGKWTEETYGISLERFYDENRQLHLDMAEEARNGGRTLSDFLWDRDHRRVKKSPLAELCPALTAFDKCADEYNAIRAFADEYGFTQAEVDAWFSFNYRIDFSEVERERRALLAAATQECGS